MKRFVLIICSILALSVSYGTAQTKNQTTPEDSIKSFLTKMYNDKLYEDYDFLQKHCSDELLKKLQDAYTYDSDAPAYATWLFRSSWQDSKPGSDDKTMMLDVTADGDWYLYKALDMGWEFTNRIKVISKDGNIQAANVWTCYHWTGFWKWLFRSHYFDVMLDECRKIYPFGGKKAVLDGYTSVYTNTLESISGDDIHYWYGTKKPLWQSLR